MKQQLRKNTPKGSTPPTSADSGAEVLPPPTSAELGAEVLPIFTGSSADVLPTSAELGDEVLLPPHA